MRSCAPGSWELTGDPVFQSYKARTWKRAVTLVNSTWYAITALAEKLLKRKAMTGLMVKATLDARRRARSRSLLSSG
jgi:hypothetical protein